jgi:hypothetical protein
MDAGHDTVSASTSRALFVALGAPVLGVAALATWLWIDRGASILLDIGSLFCF